MFKLGKLTDYGTVVMTALAARPDALRNAHDLAAETHVAAPTVSKLLKQLQKSGLVESIRGAHGGYRLARSPERITVADVVSALEGPIALTQCSVHDGGCSIESHCGVRGNWRLINTAIRQALESVTLAQMAEPMRGRRPTGKDSPMNFLRKLGQSLPQAQE
ncbi:SUF system Fe-S cluster assembly regulator [Nevskia soli]|uniref:SUF system Fe-S cluster assembly regulator n=1 Tax=Nevskia soli TaxID=418856 RepID=UPI0004A72CAB|nr:SUF system Fe-S cluster assembly regulator [Nevskia soli]